MFFESKAFKGAKFSECTDTYIICESPIGKINFAPFTAYATHITDYQIVSRSFSAVDQKTFFHYYRYFF